MATFSGVFVLLFCCFLNVLGTRTKEKIYVTIYSSNACFRRLNATHQIGCTSERGGNVGVVQLLNDQKDFDWLLETGANPPYMAIISATNFTLDNVLRLDNSERVNGLMVLDGENDTITVSEVGFSPDHTCPGDPYGLYKDSDEYKNCKKGDWNSIGNSMMFQDYSIPIFVLSNQTEIDFIVGCYEKFNKAGADGVAPQYPLCAMEMKDSMDGAKDAITCIRRSNHMTNLSPDKYCDPLGDKNIIASVKAVARSDNISYSVIMVAARMDSFSMFDNEYPSADNHVTGIVALLAAAEALATAQMDIVGSNTSRDILFTFFNGEAFDYIGSSKMVYDMEHGKFPPNSAVKKIGLSNVSHFIELRQLGYQDEGKLWIHSDPISKQNKTVQTEIMAMINSIKSISADIGIPMDQSSDTLPLPPSSVQRFLMKKTIPAVVITDHKFSYTNKFYNSRFDLAKAINDTYPPGLNESERYDYITDQAKSLARISTTIAQVLYNLSTGESPPSIIEADPTSVTHMLYCFLYEPKCELFKQILDADDNKDLKNAKQPFPFYVSVDSLKNHVSKLTKHLLALYLGSGVNATSQTDCEELGNKNKLYKYIWMQGPIIDNTRKGQCIRSTADESDAVSPAFKIKDYDWLSGEYSTWTESIWSTLSVRVFLVPSKELEGATFAVGLVVLFLSLAVVYVINRRACILFDNSDCSSEQPIRTTVSRITT